MRIAGRSVRAVGPVVGGAAAVVAGGVLAPAAHATPAVPEADDASLALVGGGPGTFESCDAYFGFGKELVAFDVVDQNGADGVDHRVPDDTQVVIVLENDDGDRIECTPVEVTQQDWDDLAAQWGIQAMPAFPGPGHYVYPSLEVDPFIDDDFGEASFVGFRVVGVPGSHTLVAPTDVVELFQSALDGEDLVFLAIVDPRVLDHIESTAGADAATAWQDAADACNSDAEPDLSDEDLQAAVESLEALAGVDIDDESGCGGLSQLNLQSSIILGLEESSGYTETITLAVPEAPTTTAPPTTTVPPTTTPPSSVLPSSTAAVTPTSALARTGGGPSSSVPLTLVGLGSIAGGALVLEARRRRFG